MHTVGGLTTNTVPERFRSKGCHGFPEVSTTGVPPPRPLQRAPVAKPDRTASRYRKDRPAMNTCLSESSVYRILKAYDLIASPTFIVLPVGKTESGQTRCRE